jgi:small subunit ribosomal protein S13
MFRLLGHVLPERKAIGMALTNIYGIGRSTAKDVCEKAGIDFNKKVKDLTEDEQKAISDIVRNDYVLENDLRRQVN